MLIVPQVHAITQRCLRQADIAHTDDAVITEIRMPDAMVVMRMDGDKGDGGFSPTKNL